MTDPITWAAVAMAGVSNMATWLVIVKGKRNGGNSKNPGLGPGKAEICIKRGEEMATFKAEQKNIKDDIHEIKGAINDIRNAVMK